MLDPAQLDHNHPVIKRIYLYILLLTYALFFLLAVLAGNHLLTQNTNPESLGKEATITPKAGQSGSKGGGPQVTPGPVGEGTVHCQGGVSLPSTVSDSGTINVTAALQTFVDALPDGSCVKLSAGGHYWVEGGLTLTNKHNFTIDGNGAEMFATAPGVLQVKGARQHIHINRGSNIVVENLTITGPNASGVYTTVHEAESGVSITSADHVTLRDLKITKTYGDAVDLNGEPVVPGSGQPEIPDTNITIVATTKGRGGSFKIDTIGRTGFGLFHADGVVIDGVDIGSVTRSIVDMESDRVDDYTKNFTMQNCEVGHANLNFIAAGGRGIRQNILIKNNHLSGMSMHGKMGTPTVGKDRFNFTFDGNVSDVAHQGNSPLIALNGFQGFLFQNNTQSFNGSGAVVAVTDSCDVTVKSNTTHGATKLLTGDLSCHVLDGGGNSF